MTKSKAPKRAPSLHAVITTAWIAVLVGLALQIVILFAKGAVGAGVSQAQAIIDVAGGVTWAMLVCAGVAAGTVAARQSGSSVGLIGLICAPLAFAGAKGVQRGLGWLLGQPLEKYDTLVYLSAGLKALEYALLAMALAFLIGRPRTSVTHFLGVGTLFGFVFRFIFLWLNQSHSPTPLPPARIVGLALNEMIFPIACSLVIYVVARLAESRDAMERMIQGGG